MRCCDCLDEITEHPPGVFECDCGQAFVVEKVGMLGSVELYRPVIPVAPEARA